MPVVVPLLAAGYSIYQSAHNANKAKKDENSLEESLNNAPRYKPNQSILNYYQKALDKYNVNPTDTREYKATAQGIKQGTTQAISSLQSRRSGLAGIPTVIANQNNSLLKAAINSENRKAQELGVLGQATGMKAGEEGKAFQQNSIYPFEAKYNLLSMKAAGERATQRQATQNIYNNLSAASSLYDGGGTDTLQQNSFGNRYGSQGAGAYNWAKANNMNFGQYRRTSNRVGRSLTNFGY